MNDLIDRQAAIDALMEIIDRPNHAEFLYTDEICKTLNKLPSAQPEPIRCKDCRHNYNCDIQYHAQAGNMFYCGAAERREDEQ